MNRLVVIVLVTVSCVNAVLAQVQSSINPASVYHQTGTTVMSPNQPGWILLRSSKSEIVFEKRGADEILVAFVKTIKTKIFEHDKDLLISLEALKQVELSKLKRDSVHFNHVRFKGSPCVQYDGIFKVDEASAPKSKNLNFKGYLCRHPDSKDSVIHMEFSDYSNARGLSESLLSLTDEFFQRIVFSKIAGPV